METMKLITNLDLQAKNIMIACSDPTVFEEWERAGQEEPSPRKVDGDQVIYKSRDFVLRKYLRGIGRCMIADLGMTYIGKQHDGFIQPDIYRAAEVMLCMPWSSAADIWNVGVMVCMNTIPTSRPSIIPRFDDRNPRSNLILKRSGIYSKRGTCSVLEAMIGKSPMRVCLVK
jgi:hypothetical protein